MIGRLLCKKELDTKQNTPVSDILVHLFNRKLTLAPTEVEWGAPDGRPPNDRWPEIV